MLCSAWLLVLVSVTQAWETPQLRSGLYPKMLAGAPEEFARHTLPSPLSAAVASDVATFAVLLADAGRGMGSAWKKSLLVDSPNGFSITVFSPVHKALHYSLTDPSGKSVDLAPVTSQSFFPGYDTTEAQNHVNATVFVLPNMPVGEYEFTARAKDFTAAEIARLMAHETGARGKDRSLFGHGMLVLYCHSSNRIFTHVNTYNTKIGAQVGLVAQMYDSSEHPQLVRGQRPPALKDIVLEARLEAIFPDGRRVEERMHDDGLHGDLEANDGVFAGSFAAAEAGEYSVQALLKGFDNNGPFIRTSEHIVPVVNSDLTLAPAAIGTMDEDMLVLSIPVQGELGSVTQYRTYAQVWGRGVNGTTVPVAWVSAFGNVVTVVGHNALRLSLNTSWIARADATEPFVLRDVYVQDTTSFVPLDSAVQIPLQLSAGHSWALRKRLQSLRRSKGVNNISKEMRQGRPPAHLRLRNTTTSSNPKLVLLHGYCADKNPWQLTAEVWTDALYFLRANQGMAHDEFAQHVLEFTAAQQLTSYGLIGHSQGGIVSLHILNYYHSELDLATGPRKIQSVGSPYMGNSAAGFGLKLADLFNLGCGANTDLTLDGAALWLSGITEESAAQTNIYTSQYDKGGLFGEGWCNMLANSLMHLPNDGATELDYAVLPGGVHRGNTVGQCHIQDMNWPAVFLDVSRNTEMNNLAAR
eukprot:m.153286 g.153286  ORF g.153286 m.153286 type:complete len:695 (-) comp20754_c1_seq1:37-2121(-)